MKHDIINFGCRLNHFESEVIRQDLSNLNNDQKIAVFNTCAVTKEAERQARQAIRKYAKQNPDAKIIVTGCAAQINPDQFIKMPEISQILGNKEKENISQYIIDDTGFERAIVNDIMSVTETAPHMVKSFDSKTRAFIQIQNGCNHRCTFCIIPYGRGNSRSVAIGDIVTQVNLLSSQGYREIVLTGVDITDYGLDLPGKPSLGQMIRRLLKLSSNIERLRLSSIDVAEIDEDLIDIIKNDVRLMPHFHISLQSGDNMILKRMKRRHMREDVIDFCNKIRLLRPDVTFGADIIAGFPTETDEMHDNSVKLVSEAGLSHLHVFPYSEREGTPAAKIPKEKQVPVNIRKERAAEIRKEGEKQLDKVLDNSIGKTMKINIESGSESKTENYLSCKIDNIDDKNNEYLGKIVECNIYAKENNMLIGRIKNDR